MRGRIIRSVWVILLTVCAFAALRMLAPGRVSHGQGSDSLQIGNVEANSATAGRFGKFELTFDITGTVASSPDWPYDPDPPPGVPAGVGITVDGLFSPDNWTTVYTQPAFLYQPYTYAVHNDYDHLYPDGSPAWKIRFAPPSVGVWRYRIRATDASGTVLYPASGDIAFTTQPSDNPGFLHVSEADPRYFEFEDGTPFIGVGHEEGFSRWRMVQDAAEKFSRFAAQRVNFSRIWMSSSAIVGSAWWPWSSHHLDYEGYLPATSLTIEETYADGDVSMKLDQHNPCMRQGGLQGTRYPIAVMPGRVYRVRARIKTEGISGPAQAGEPYGFVVKLGGWLGEDCASPDRGIPVTPYVTDTGGAWQVITGTLTTATDQYFLDRPDAHHVYVTLTNADGGTVYVDEVWLEEQTGPDSYGPNVLPRPKVNVHTYFDPMRSLQWDYILDEAASQGVYLKLVVLEKNEWIFNRIAPSGTMVITGTNSNFYATPDSKVRWLHQAWWRYLVARWSYSTAVHSWELLNEGDPFNGYHYNQAQAFAKYVHENDPNRHMVTTSFWHSFPMYEFWDNPAYPDMDYADLHAYISTGWGEYAVIPDTPPSPLAYTDVTDYDGTGWSVTLDGDDYTYSTNLWSLDIQDEGEWLLRYRLKLEGWSGSCSQGDELSGPRLIWWMWGLDGFFNRNVVPPRADGVDTRCSTPISPTDWVSYDSSHTFDGEGVPLEARIIITDSQPRAVTIGVQNTYGNAGTAYIDTMALVAPDGTVLATNGSIRLDPMHEDAALYTSGYSLLWGGKSPAGASMPLVRGEGGLDHPGGPQQELTDLAQDTEGVWLHNMIWGGINPGGMYDLYWWPDNIRDYDLYYHYKPYQDFMDGIPLNNGCYQNVKATTSSPDLRAWGQKDTVHGKAHVWIQNRNHTWRNVVDGVTISGLSGQIVIPNMRPGPYQVEWWDTYSGAVTMINMVDASTDGLVLDLPASLVDDVAVQVNWMGPSLSSSTKAVNRTTAMPGDILTYTVTIVNSGMVSVTAIMTDDIPIGSTYVFGSASVTPEDAGNLDDMAGIQWQGALGAGETVTVTFAVQVDSEEGPSVILNVAVIDAALERTEVQVLTLINALQTYLPLILKVW